MRDPLDMFGRYFMEIAGCWIAVMVLAFLWLGFHIVRGMREKRAARRAAASVSHETGSLAAPRDGDRNGG